MELATTALMGVGQVLSVLVALAAMAIAIGRWARHPVVSMLVVVSMGLKLLISAAWMVVPRVMDISGGHQGYVAVSAGLSLLGVLALGLLVAAAFVDRPAGAEPPTQRW